MGKEKIVILEKRFYIHPVFNNYAASKDGEVVNPKTMKPFRGFSNGKGENDYLQFTIGLGKNKVKKYCVHRFVFECVKGVIPDGFEINHRNEIKTDNSIGYLELVTHQQNTELSKNKKVISIILETNEKKNYLY